MSVNNYGFIITRHVNSEETNKYWNRCVRCIRKFYPLKKIIIIDDNSVQTFVKAENIYLNVEVIHSEFPGRGELLPYYYFYKNHFFNNAVIIHDSVFFHRRINFEIVKYNAIPIWHFNQDKENLDNTFRLAKVLKNNNDVIESLLDSSINILGLGRNKWFGCFGLQSYINHKFLTIIQEKYSLFNLLNFVKNRNDRCCMERIIGIIFFGTQKNLYKSKSLLGNIMTYHKWGYTFEQDCNFLETKKGAPSPLDKVWTGR